MTFFDTLKKYWILIEIPTYFIFIWTIFIIVFPLIKYFDAIFSQMISLFVFITYFWYIGYLVFTDKELFEKSFKVGLFAGFILGLFTAIVSLFAFYFYPSIFYESLKLMTENGLSNEQAIIFLKINLYSSFIISPVVNGLLGGFISWLSFLFFRKFKSNNSLQSNVTEDKKIEVKEITSSKKELNSKKKLRKRFKK
jgi:hypothetical protein